METRALELLPIAAFTFRDILDITIVQANHLFYELIGISKDKFSRYNGNRLSTICNLNDLCRMNEKLAKAAAEHDNIIYLESRIDCGQQDTRWMLLHIYYNKNNGSYLSFVFDFSCYFGQDSDSYFHTRDLAVALKRTRTDAFSYDFKSHILHWHTENPILFPEITHVDIFSYYEKNKIMHPADVETIRQTFAEIARKPKELSLNIRLKTELSYGWYHLTMIKGKGDTYLCILEDITETENRLKSYQIESKYWNLMKDSLVAYGEVDVTDDKIMQVAGMWTVYEEAKNTIPYGELIETYIRKTVHPMDREGYIKLTKPQNYYESYQQGISILSCSFRRKDGNKRMCWMQLMVHLFENYDNGHLIAILYLVRDKSEGRYAMEVNALPKNTIDDSDTSVFESYLNKEGEIAYLIDPQTYEFVCGNHALYRTFNIQPSECAGMKCYTLLHGRNRPCDFCQEKNWSTNQFFCWKNWNPVMEKSMLLKNKLITYNGHIVLLVTSMSIPDHIVHWEKDTGEQVHLLDYGKKIIQARDIGQVRQMTFEYLSDFYSAEYACICKNNQGSQQFQDICIWSQEGSTSISRLQILTMPGDQKERFSLIRTEDLKRENWRGYTWLQEYGIDNVMSFRLDSEVQEPISIHLLNVNANRTNSAFGLTVLDLYWNELQKQQMIEDYTYHYYHDSLTGFLNRLSFEEYLRLYREDAIESIGVILSDINGLKMINNEHGQAAGNKLIMEYCRILEMVLNDDTLTTKVFRLNGDEFLILLENCSLEEFTAVIELLEKQLTLCDGLSVAIGYTWEQIDKDMDQLLLQSGNLMQMDKQKFYDSKRVNSNSAYYNVQRELISALNKKEYCIFLQPKVNTLTREIIGAEALIRYRHPTEGIYTPNRFLPLLEGKRLIRYIDLFVLEEVCGLLKRWETEGRKLFPISLNFSRLTLVENGIVENVESIVKKYNIPRKYLEIEITETVGELSKSITVNVVNAFKRLGYRILLDDFGTKYTNLSIITEVNFDELKLDKGLISSLSDTVTNQIVIKNVIAMCQDLHKDVIAEGIELSEQEKILQEFGCVKGQGYLYGKPMQCSEFELIC